MILLIDNYDSFSYNLVQLAGSISPNITVVRNDEITVSEIEALDPSHIILSPGPGYPKDAGVCEDLVLQLSRKTPILGVCLGHQSICEAFGAKICRAQQLMHGKKSVLNIKTDSPVFKGLPDSIEVGRYHSLIAKEDTIPSCLRVIATDSLGEVMAVEHIAYPTYGLQFHPESILSPKGIEIMKNFLDIKRY